MTSPGRYRNAPADITEYIEKLKRRVEALEQNPRIGNTSVDSGQLTVRGGDIIVENSAGVDVLHLYRQNLFGRPEIRFNPQGFSSTKVTSIYGVYEAFDGVVQTGLKMEIQNPNTNILAGGFMHAYETASKLGYSSGGSDSFIQVGFVGGVGGSFYIKGHYLNASMQSSFDAIYTQTLNTGGGFSSQSYTYPITFSGFPRVIASLVNFGGVVQWTQTATSNTGCTISWAGTAAKTTSIWVFRL